MPFGGTRSNTTADSQLPQVIFFLTGLRKQFGWRLRQERDRRCMSQEGFAELLEISVDFLSLVERGRSSPSFKTLEIFARRLKVPVAYLFDFRDVEPPARKRNLRLKSA